MATLTLDNRPTITTRVRSPTHLMVVLVPMHGTTEAITNRPIDQNSSKDRHMTIKTLELTHGRLSRSTDRTHPSHRRPIYRLRYSGGAEISLTATGSTVHLASKPERSAGVRTATRVGCRPFQTPWLDIDHGRAPMECTRDQLAQSMPNGHPFARARRSLVARTIGAVFLAQFARRPIPYVTPALLARDDGAGTWRCPLPRRADGMQARVMVPCSARGERFAGRETRRTERTHSHDHRLAISPRSCPSKRGIKLRTSSTDPTAVRPFIAALGHEHRTTQRARALKGCALSICSCHGRVVFCLTMAFIATIATRISYLAKEQPAAHLTRALMCRALALLTAIPPERDRGREMYTAVATGVYHNQLF